MTVEAIDVECETCSAAPRQRCRGVSRPHRRRLLAAEAAGDYDGSPIPVSAVAHPNIAGMWIARYSCPACGQQHWAVWGTDRLDGDLVPHRSPCRIARHLRPAQVWLRVRSTHQFMKSKEKSA